MAANDTQTVHVQTLFSYALQPYRFDISAPQKLRIEPHSTQPFAYVVYGNGNQGDQLTITITDTAAQSSHLEKKLVVDFTEPIDVIKRPVMADLDEPAHKSTGISRTPALYWTNARQAGRGERQDGRPGRTN
ncbi:hypothetical protein ACG2F4_03635 [Halalkalibaculum sp. DA3122]|uniref:hypothetical protein n=1 Tax=Halalkalibaculum sp. DA3122 TaxID=3373607 RepID=UPI0037547AE0